MFELKDVLTIEGTTLAAVFITGIVELLKTALPIIVARQAERTVAIFLAAVLAIFAVADTHNLTPNAVLVGTLAWVWMGQAAMKLYDKVLVPAKAAIAGPSD